MESTASERVVIAYVSSPHAGYLKFFRRHAGGKLCVLGDSFIKEFNSLVRFLPAATPDENRRMIESLGIFESVQVLTPYWVARLSGHENIVMPDEDVSHAFAEKHFRDANVTFDGSWRLRWDWGATQKKVRPEGGIVSRGEFERQMMHTAHAVAEKSPDWWRQVGAVLARDGEPLLFSYNKHLPHEQSGYLLGDPRSNFEQGAGIEVSIAGHGEAMLVAEAARRGLSMKGCDLFVSTFPCPPCANLLSNTGISRLYYEDGYAVLEGENVLRSKDIEIIRVELTQPS